MHLKEIIKFGVNKFKLQLDKYLSKISEEPCSTGLTPSAQDPVTKKARNSLLHQTDWARRQGLLQGIPH